MKFRDCITGKGKAGKIDQRRAREAAAMYDTLFDRYRQTMDEESADAAASADTQKRFGERIAQENEANIKAALFQVRVGEKIKTIRSAKQKFRKGKVKYGEAVGDFLEGVFDRVQAIRRQSFAPINEFISKHGSKWAGLVQDHSGLQNVVREILGEGTGDASASLFGKEIRKVFDMLHRQYQDAGGVIGKLDNYFPQRHRHDLVAASSFQEWRDYLMPRLDRAKMLDSETGFPINDIALDALMREDYEAIASNGLSEIRKRAAEGKQTAGFGGDIGRRREDSRFYHFKDADSYLEYNRRFGYGDSGLFDAVIGHVQSMARDIAVMQEMGPKANGLMRHIELTMEGSGDGRTRLNWTKGMYDVLTGRHYMDADAPGWYKFLEGTKDWLRAALLGSAPISAMTDNVYAGMAAKMNGLNAVRTMGQYFKNLDPTNEADRRMLARQGYIMESLLGLSFSTARFADDATGPQWTRALSGAVNRASGLQAMTEAVKNAPVFELQATLAEAKVGKKKLSDMPEEFQRAMQERGMGEKAFKAWMQSELFEHPDRKGVNFLRPDEVAKTDIEAAMALDKWQSRLRYLAANEPTLRTRAITTGAFAGDARPGTANRAFWSSAMLFKSFVVTQTINYLIPAMRNAQAGRMGDLAMLAVGMTVMGGFVTQVKEVLRGKDPRDMEDPRFWGAASLQGGGFGIFSDYLFADYNRYGRTIVETAAGPVAGFAMDTAQLALGNFQDYLDEKDPNWGRSLMAYAGRYTPGLNLWYGRTVVERGVMDALNQAADPNYSRRMRQIERDALKTYGQEYWWRPGQRSPDRAPELEAALGGAR